MGISSFSSLSKHETHSKFQPLLGINVSVVPIILQLAAIYCIFFGSVCFSCVPLVSVGGELSERVPSWRFHLSHFSNESILSVAFFSCCRNAQPFLGGWTSQRHRLLLRLLLLAVSQSFGTVLECFCVSFWDRCHLIKHQYCMGAWSKLMLVLQTELMSTPFQAASLTFVIWSSLKWLKESHARSVARVYLSVLL